MALDSKNNIKSVFIVPANATVVTAGTKVTPGSLALGSVVITNVSNEVLATTATGTVAFDPTDDRFLLYSINPDTIPSNTLSPVNAVIDPLRSGPGAGLAVATLGQRYLLTEATGSEDGYAEAWAGLGGQPLVAEANDIVEYDGQRWIVSFDSENSPDNIQYVTNITTSIQYEWTGTTWIKSYQGLYPGGTWSLVL